ncbi:MAG: class I SAM-dependent methyltransferase [Chlorobiaceae bacterium]|nr:class I SAM-dependent methyltransferase [Chlorobiaceae bacterium]
MSDNNWTDSQRFDSKASEWDANAVRAALADAVSRAILAHMPVSRPEKALEFGCGTGLVTLRVAPGCGSLTAVDTSREMLRVLSEKIAAGNITNISPLFLDLTQPDAASRIEGSFDFVFSSMTLHHIPDTRSFIAQLYGHMAPGGTLAIADLDTEDGMFHDDVTEKVHYGFDRDELKNLMESAGFTNVSFITAHMIEKKNRAGQRAYYPVFLVTATKPQI